MARHAIPPERLRWQPDGNDIPGDSTRDIPVLDGTLGQDAALEALHYGIASPGHNQHVFLRGPRGSGRRRLLDSLFGSLRPKARQNRDFCFVHNFSNPDRPRLIILPRGEGRPFQKQMHRIALFVRERLPDILANDPIRGRREARREAAERDIRLLLRPLEKKLEAEGLALIRSQAGPNARLQVSVRIMGKPVSQEEFRNMVARKQATEEDRKKFEERIKSYDEEINKISRQIRKKWQQAQQHIEQIDITETARIMGEMTAEVSQRFKADGIEVYLREVIDDVLEKRIGHETSQLADPTVLYGVNVLNMGREDSGAPAISTSSISPASLFGTVDPAWRSGGRAVASFQGIRSGTLIQADGGFLILDAEDLASEPGVFRQLLRILRAGEVSIAAPTADWSQAAQSLRPEAVPIDVGVILVGDAAAYAQLESISREFSRRFRLLADLEASVERDGDGIDRTCRFVSAVVQREALLPLTRPGLAAVVEISARLSDQPGRLTTRVGRLAEVIREAAFLAAGDDETEIGREHVEAAFGRIRHRAGLPAAGRIQHSVDSGLIRLRGRSAGQLNVISRERLADEMFGAPARLSLTAARGAGNGISLESGEGELPVRQFLLPMLTELLHLDALPDLRVAMTLDPAVLPDDAASTLLGQACGLIAVLAGLSVRQELAVIGSIDARGQVGRVDYLNERIEGYFDACNRVGLNGQQGVIIPAVDKDRLALDKRVIKACTNDQFHIMAAASIAEALERLTGKTAGIWKDDGFPEDSVLGMARASLQA
ncbi:AAA family ATPase [Wenzhouxiangella sediminis]|uniref:AAA family ATPase n=1 Tax=Wenzhouxiangella sediminis TaxID=1792836 RepID=UPI0015F26A37|nr:AAA family ATPase [Wenzhouxiangella sediminis]